MCYLGFIESYKHLEKLCGEVLNDDRRISAYIDEMINTPRGSSLIKSWDDDLKQLKHYRWVRNKIAHEPGYSEENMCDANDALWLDNFYARIMNQSDPLALYYRATKPYTDPKSSQAYKTESQDDTCPWQIVSPNKRSRKPVGFIIFLVCTFIIVATIFIISKGV